MCVFSSLFNFFVWQFFIKLKSLICQLLDEEGLGKEKKEKKTNKASFLFLHTLNLQVTVTHTHTSPCHYKYILAGMVRRNKSLKLNVFGCL